MVVLLWVLVLVPLYFILILLMLLLLCQLFLLCGSEIAGVAVHLVDIGVGGVVDFVVVDNVAGAVICSPVLLTCCWC